VPIEFVGQLCARRGCSRPHWKDGLCNRCWRFAKLFGKDPLLLAYQPLDTDAVELPWEEWENQARERGIDVADLIAEKRG
jgi:hypothetical protein